MVIAFVNISILNDWLFLPLAAKLGSPEFARTSVSSCRVTDQTFTAQEKVCTVRLKKISLQKYGSKTKVFLDTRRKNN